MRAQLAALVVAALAAACIEVGTQKWTTPMEARVDPLPPGDSQMHPPGPEEVTVMRHADPVQVRPVGAMSGIPMAFFQKKTRLTAGGQVIVSPGGRAEILWSEGSSIVIFGRGVGWIGSPSRGDPMFSFSDVERARLLLREGDRVRLVGGAVLSGPSGPYLLERSDAGVLAVHNQSKGRVTVAFRDEEFELGPGQRVVLPLLSAGGVPIENDLASQRITGAGFTVQVNGDFDPIPDDVAVHLRARAGPAERVARGLGVSVRLAPGEEVRFGGLEAVTGEAAIAEPLSEKEVEHAAAPEEGAGGEERPPPEKP